MTKILLVEDDKSLREIYGVRLLAEGYDIVSAGDGEEALAMAIKEKPQLIVSDVMMPKISGFDMLDILRSTTETRDIKVIMMTALSSDDQRARGEQLGADRYLVKSQVGIEDVVSTVHEVLADKEGTAAAAPTDSHDAPVEAPTEAPVADPAPVETPVEPVVEPAPVEVPAVSEQEVVAPVAAPGNENAGPLPPQPSEVEPLESSLPQPTAPFSSDRPNNLGENVLQPSDNVDTPAPEVTAEPIAPVEPVVTPLVDTPQSDDKDAELTNGGLGFDNGPTPVEPAPILDTPETTEVSAPEVSPVAPVAPEVPSTNPIVENTTEEQTTPTVGPATPVA